MTAPAYRCAGCVEQVDRCDPCRARRAAARRKQRAARRRKGLCTECGRKVKKDLTLCRAHALALAERSNEAHKRARVLRGAAAEIVRDASGKRAAAVVRHLTKRAAFRVS